MDALSAAVVEVLAIFGGFPHFDCGAGNVGGSKDDGVLDWRDDGDVKSNSAAVDLISDGGFNFQADGWHTKMVKFES